MKAGARSVLGLPAAALVITFRTPSSALAIGGDDGWNPSKPSGSPSEVACGRHPVVKISQSSIVITRSGGIGTAMPSTEALTPVNSHLFWAHGHEDDLAAYAYDKIDHLGGLRRCAGRPAGRRLPDHPGHDRAEDPVRQPLTPDK